MTIIANILVAAVALLHVYIMLLEMLWWDSPRGQKAFNLTPEFAKQTKVMAANQGLYNIGQAENGHIGGVEQPLALVLILALFGGNGEHFEVAPAGQAVTDLQTRRSSFAIDENLRDHWQVSLCPAGRKWASVRPTSSFEGPGLSLPVPDGIDLTNWKKMRTRR